LGAGFLSFLVFLPFTDTGALFQYGNSALRKQRVWHHIVSTAETGKLHEKMTLEQTLLRCKA
jgi:hypothetical protein